jgi:enolase-phosphatase E1
LQGWVDQDRKHTALKALQGMIWRDGYQQGAYTAHVYDDAAANRTYRDVGLWYRTKLRAWHAAGHPLYVYSSGSVEAQRPPLLRSLVRLVYG